MALIMTGAMSGITPALARWSGAAAGSASGAVLDGCAVITAPEEAAAPTTRPPASAATGQATAVGATVAVTAFLPPIVTVRVDADGLPFVVKTNSGFAPSPTDLFFVRTGENARQPASSCIRQAVLRAVGSAPGSWRPDDWHGLDGSPSQTSYNPR